MFHFNLLENIFSHRYLERHRIFIIVILVWVFNDLKDKSILPWFEFKSSYVSNLSVCFFIYFTACMIWFDPVAQIILVRPLNNTDVKCPILILFTLLILERVSSSLLLLLSLFYPLYSEVSKTIHFYLSSFFILYMFLLIHCFALSIYTIYCL